MEQSVIKTRQEDAQQETTTVVVVDDDVRIGELLSRYLTDQGLRVLTASGGSELALLLQNHHVDMMVLDVMLGHGENGFEICQRMRAAHDNTPVIMLTARGAEDDRITGLDVGADDYLGKPFNPRELLARIHAVLRRRGSRVPGAPANDDQAVVRFDGICFDMGLRKLYGRDGQELPLTTREFAVLKALVSHPRQPLSREKLSLLARGCPLGQEVDRNLDVHISRLRKRIERDSSMPRHLQTVWGVGYVFVPESTTPAKGDAALP